MPPVLIMLAPSKLALETSLLIWLTSEVKSEAIAARSVVDSEVSDASRAFDFIWFRRSEMVWPAVTATSSTEEARFRESVTAPRPATWERWPWAIAQMEPLSLALATRRPVEIWFWAVWSWLSVLLRVWSATIAPTLVLMLFSDISVSLPSSTRFSRRQAHFAARLIGVPKPSEANSKSTGLTSSKSTEPSGPNG